MAHAMELPKWLLYLSLLALFIPLSPSSVSLAASLTWNQWRDKGEDKEKLRNLKFVWNLFPWTFHTIEQKNISISQQQGNHMLHNSKTTHPKQKQVKNNCINQSLQRDYTVETWSLSEHWIISLEYYLSLNLFYAQSLLFSEGNNLKIVLLRLHFSKN